MLLRSCLDLFCKQIFLPRPIIRFQTAQWYSAHKTELYPPPPKRNKSAWVLFFTDNWTEIRNEFPGASKTELFNKVAEKWRSSDKVTLEKYNQLALEDKIKYARAVELYKSNLSDEEKLAIAQKKVGPSKKINHKKHLKALGMPKKPPNAYILFSMDYANKHFKSSSDYFTQAKKIGQLWTDLPASEKSKFVALAAEEEKEYKRKLGQWEAEMTAKGHIEVIHTKEK